MKERTPVGDGDTPARSNGHPVPRTQACRMAGSGPAPSVVAGVAPAATDPVVADRILPDDDGAGTARRRRTPGRPIRQTAPGDPVPISERTIDAPVLPLCRKLALAEDDGDRCATVPDSGDRLAARDRTA